MNDIVLKALAPERLTDLIDFFEQRAFADHPQWRSCYCHFPHADHDRVVWKERSADENRAATGERVAAGTMQGWLAYADGAVVGWCNAGPRVLIGGMFDEPEPLAERIGAIVCFVVAPDWRGRGVATALLQRACEGLAAQGFEWAEGYPRTGEQSAAANHFGPLAMFEVAGFRVHKPDDDDGVVVRRRLQAP